MIKQSLLVAGTVATIGLAAGGVGIASAATNNAGSDTMVDKISQKFNLNKDDVQKVFDENRSERQAEMKTRAEARLTQAVTDKKITEEQKQQILAKQAELQKEHEAERGDMKNKTPEERRTHMEQERAEIKKWAEDNKIPEEYLHIGGGSGNGGPRGSHGPRM